PALARSRRQIHVVEHRHRGLACHASRSQAQGRRVLTDTAPYGALTWGSAAERNKRLMPWRRAVSMTFAEQPRCLRVAWALDQLSHAKTGYASPPKKHLADVTGLPINKVQEALATLESDGAIMWVTIGRPNGQNQRVIYPANALIPPPAVG